NLNQNLGSLAEVTGFSQSLTDSTLLLAGTQANGSIATNAQGGSTWRAVNGGDGGYNEIDPNPGTDDGTSTGNPVPAGNIWYTSSPGVSVQRCIVGAGCNGTKFGLPPNYINANIETSQVAGDLGDFFTPFQLEPRSTKLLLVGTC